MALYGILAALAWTGHVWEALLLWWLPLKIGSRVGPAELAAITSGVEGAPVGSRVVPAPQLPPPADPTRMGRRRFVPGLHRHAAQAQVGRGLGDKFVQLAKERSSAGLQLWTFQANEPARRFYARAGFVPCPPFGFGNGNAA